LQIFCQLLAAVVLYFQQVLKAQNLEGPLQRDAVLM
jgi:hypothetical protein